jgi:dTDP-4-amino-4,6-dideoxy-D-galactose acyltransferase
MKPEFLAWDSKFFNLNVGRLVIEADEEIPVLRLNDFDLVYIIIKNNLPDLKKKYFETRAFFADEKLTYQKEIRDTTKPGNNILSWPAGKRAERDLLDIGVQSGEFSRFKIDPEIPGEKFIALYEQWVINSVNRKIAEEVYYFEDNGAPAGMITLSIKNGKADIGILSVHKNSRGKGIATGLVKAAEYWGKNIKGFGQIQVVTQAANTVACKFYEKNGFLIHTREYVFHWWKKLKDDKDPL